MAFLVAAFYNSHIGNTLAMPFAQSFIGPSVSLLFLLVLFAAALVLFAPVEPTALSVVPKFVIF